MTRERTGGIGSRPIRDAYAHELRGRLAGRPAGNRLRLARVTLRRQPAGQWSDIRHDGV